MISGFFRAYYNSENNSENYNSEEIRTFIPRARRIAEMNCSHDACLDFDSCDNKVDHK